MIEDNQTIAIGGNVLHRAPMAMLREIVRKEIKGLHLVKTAGGMDVDLLCLAGCVESVDAGFISYEHKYSLANHYRKAVQNGEIKAHEHACYTVMSALRAGAANVGFMPVKGLVGSDLIDSNDYFKVIEDPFSGENITVVKAIRPDVAIIHAQQADENGNAIIFPPKYDDVLISRAAKKVIITAEKIVGVSSCHMDPEKVDIPGFLVAAVVEAPSGAEPCSCEPLYDINWRCIETFLKYKEKADLEKWLAAYDRQDHFGKGAL